MIATSTSVHLQWIFPFFVSRTVGMQSTTSKATAEKICF
jgi:hypothetical protein